MAIKEFFKKTKLRRIVIPVIIIFMVIVACLAVSSSMVNQKATSAIREKAASTKTIVQTENEDFEENLNTENVDYTKIGNDIYIVNYKSSEQAQNAIDEGYNSESNVKVSEDAVFETAGTFSSVQNVSKLTDTLPEDMTWREYADSVGKKLIAVIDTGVSEDYAAVRQNFTADSDEDKNGHGTSVAKSIISNAKDKAIIMSLKAIEDDGIGYMSDIMNAVQYARDQHVDIINMSIAGDAKDSTDAFVSLIKDTLNDGIKVVAAAGNYQSNVKSYIPAGIDGVISVGAVDKNGVKTYFSNYGDITYYENAYSTSEAAAIITGKLASESDFSQEITKDTVVVKDEDKAENDYQISTKNDNGDFELQYTSQTISASSGGKGTVTLESHWYPGDTRSGENVYFGGNWFDTSQRVGCNVYASAYNGYVLEGIDVSGARTDVSSDFDGNGYHESSSVTIVPGTNTTATAKYRLAKVTVDYAGGGNNTTKKSTGKDSHVNLGSPTRTGYRFKGWSVSGGGWMSGKEYYYGTSDGTATATWEKADYNLKVSPNGGILVGGNFGSKNNTNQDADVTVTYGTSYYLYPLGTAKKEGYIFKGFYTATSGGSQIIKSDGYVANDGTYCNNNTWQYTGNLNIYAQWDEIQYSVKYNANGGTGTVASQDNKKYTDKFNLQANAFAKTGYLFDGWYLNPECTGTKYTEGQQVSKLSATNGATVTFYAKWVPIKYNVEFNANGGRHVRNNANDRKDYNVERTDEAVQLVGGKTASQTQTYDSATRLTGNGFTWEGHTFLGWSKDPNATSATWKDGDFASDSKTSKGGLTVNSNETVTLYAIWKADEHTVTVNPVKGNGTWNSAGDPNQSGSASPKKGEDSVTRDGSGNTKWGDKIILGEAIPDNKDATVTYDVNTDDSVTIDKTSETVHWKFSKWTTDRKNGNKELLHNNSARANDGSHDNGEQTYYILQDTNDTVTANYYMQTVALPTPTREGYTFLGWYYDAACTDKVDGRGAGGTKYPLDANGEEMKAEYHTRGNGGDTFRTDGDVTIYARWQKNIYNYADTEQVFMQDDENQKKPGDFSVRIRKVDANTRQPLVEKSGESFVLGIYKEGVSDRNLLYRLDTAKGIYQGNTDTLALKKTTNLNGWYEIEKLIKKVPGYDTATFIVHEISAPKGWSIAPDQSFKISDTDIQITVKDEKYTPPVKNYFTKVDSQGRAVSNVTFELQDVSDSNKAVWTGTTNSKGTFDYEKNPDTGKYDISFYSFCKAGHTYSLVEKNAPEGFKLGDPVTFKVPATGTWTPDTIKYVDKVASAKLKVRKLNSDDKPLKGAVFQLYMKDANGTLVPCYMDKTTLKWVEADGESDTVSIMTATTDNDGNAYFDGLPLRALFTGSEPDCTKSYYLKEIQAPEGYSLLMDIAEIRLPADGDGKTIEFTAKDDSVTLTLEAGGSGCYMYYGLGIVMAAIALCLAVCRNKKMNS